MSSASRAAAPAARGARLPGDRAAARCVPQERRLGLLPDAAARPPLATRGRRAVGRRRRAGAAARGCCVALTATVTRPRRGRETRFRAFAGGLPVAAAVNAAVNAAGAAIIAAAWADIIAAIPAAPRSGADDHLRLLDLRSVGRTDRREPGVSCRRPGPATGRSAPPAPRRPARPRLRRRGDRPKTRVFPWGNSCSLQWTGARAERPGGPGQLSWGPSRSRPVWDIVTGNPRHRHSPKASLRSTSGSRPADRISARAPRRRALRRQRGAP